MRFSPRLTGPSTSPPTDAVGDAELLRHAQRSPDAFAPLYLAYRDRILNYCSYRLNDPEEAEDAASAIFVKALQHLPDFHDDGNSFRSWLFRIAHNEVVDRLKHVARHPKSSLAFAEVIADPAPSPEDAAVTADALGRLRALLGTLPPRERGVLELRLADLSCQEIAVVLEISEQTVWTAQSRALNRLRTAMSVSGQEARNDG